MNRMTVGGYFVNLAKIIGGNSPQSARPRLPENPLGALIGRFGVPGTTNGTGKSNSRQNLPRALAAYYTILRLFCLRLFCLRLFCLRLFCLQLLCPTKSFPI